jgi:hypothetical protein
VVAAALARKEREDREDRRGAWLILAFGLLFWVCFLGGPAYKAWDHIGNDSGPAPEFPQDQDISTI